MSARVLVVTAKVTVVMVALPPLIWQSRDTFKPLPLEVVDAPHLPLMGWIAGERWAIPAVTGRRLPGARMNETSAIAVLEGGRRAGLSALPSGIS